MPSPADFFEESYLTELFHGRIVKSKAVGRDGVRLGAFRDHLQEEVQLISRKCLAGAYRFTPYKERLILRGPARMPRQLSIPTVRDRLTLRAACNAIASIVPAAKVDPPHTYIKNIAATVRASEGPTSFVRIDVKDFFPSLQHELLYLKLKEKGAPPFLISLVANAITTPTGKRRDDAAHADSGVPQGLSISSILSSIYMEDVDSAFSRINYFRYVDDILVVCPAHMDTRHLKDVGQKLTEIRLHPHMPGTSGKTETKRVEEGIDYLGYHVTPSKISIRSSSYNKMFGNLLRVITSYKYRKMDDPFLFRLNIKISGCIVDGKRRGWVMFFAQTENMSQLKYLDEFVVAQSRRVGAQHLQKSVKKFVKAYHEIRYKGGASSYIPNFDTYDLDAKIALISRMTGEPMELVSLWSLESIDERFSRIVAQEVAELEQDVVGAVS